MLRKALEITGHGTELRPVMVHCQALRYDQLDRVKALGAVTDISPVIMLDSGGIYTHDQVFGPERAQNIYSNRMGFRKRNKIHFTSRPTSKNA